MVRSGCDLLLICFRIACWTWSNHFLFLRLFSIIIIFINHLGNERRPNLCQQSIHRHGPPQLRQAQHQQPSSILPIYSITLQCCTTTWCHWSILGTIIRTRLSTTFHQRWILLLVNKILRRDIQSISIRTRFRRSFQWLFRRIFALNKL